MRRSAVRFVPDAGAVDALLLLAHPWPALPIAMRKPFLTILFALALVAANAAAEDSPISVSLAIPAHNGERRVEYRDQATHFHVIISNTSDQPQRIWREWCSWGYSGLSFEFTDEHGKKWVAKKKAQDWTRNFPDWWTLDSHESFVMDVYFADTNTWKGFPLPENGSQIVMMQAVLEFKPGDEARQHDVWTGRVASVAEKVTFYHWKPQAK